MLPDRVLRLGTRRSLLARAQSAWVAREVERLNPGIRVELVGLDTRGDKILDVPLRSVEGKEFFVAEIDAALRNRDVDFTVHSLKDLSLERPKEFTLAAIPTRENPRDAVIFGPSAFEKLKAGKPLRIGTSAPRRLENLPDFLKRALPKLSSQQPGLEFIEIRGNVHTRLARIHAPEGADGRHLDGVVLALAGLVRLWRDPEGQAEIAPLLSSARWMILPLAECPPAPGQGALAVECRSDDTATLTAIRKLHDVESERAVHRERALLAEWGGGCHQRFGAVSVKSKALGDLMYVRGRHPAGHFIETLEWTSPPRPHGTVRPFFPGETARTTTREIGSDIRPCVFVAHARAHTPEAEKRMLSHRRIWTSGTLSWFKLAEAGLWVEGSADGLGFSSARSLLQEPVLGLDPLKDWTVLTHDQGGEEWISQEGLTSVICTYGIEFDTSSAPDIANAATHVFWGSRAQMDAWLDRLPTTVHHSTGAGKTLEALHTRLKARGRSTDGIGVFPSMKEWKKWLALKT